MKEFASAVMSIKTIQFILKLFMNRGVIYCAIGKKYLDEAVYSAKSLKKYNSSLLITLFTNSKINECVFDNIIFLNSDFHPWKVKVWCILNSPYSETLYIDTDTEILGNLDGVFSDLKKHDILIACVRDWVNGKLISFEKSDSFENKKRLNTGVIFYRNNNRVVNFIQSWFNNIGNQFGKVTLGTDCDQSIFNSLYSSEDENLKFKIIKNIEYNCRLVFIPHLSKTEKQNIKIIHQHYLNFPLYARLFLNRTIYFRYMKELIRNKILNIKVK